MHVWCSNLEPAFQSQVSSKRRHIESLLLSQWNRQYFDNSILSWTEARFALSGTTGSIIKHQQEAWITAVFGSKSVETSMDTIIILSNLCIVLANILTCAKLYDSLQYFGISSSTTTFTFQPFFTKYLVHTHYNYLKINQICCSRAR